MPANAHSYDLFERRDGWVADTMLVVSPYVEKEFFRQIARDLAPKRVSVVIDDGCRREDIEMVREAMTGTGTRRPPELSPKLGSAPGLVHIKLFYVRWRTPGGRAAHTLVYGSANATRQGFSGTMNAELIVKCRLVASRHQPIIDWCQEVIAATHVHGRVQIQPRRDVELERGMHLRLPGLTVGRLVPELSNLDLWIQRGYLLSEYRPDPSFLRVPIPLARSLAQPEQARIAATLGFATPQTKRFNYAYLDSLETSSLYSDLGDDDEDDDGVANWRRKLFVWTQLGDWCSEACYNEHQEQFRRRGFAERQERLERLEELRTAAALADARDRFLGALSDLWSALGADAPTLLHGRSGIDLGHYRTSFDQRVARDLELADDEEFRKRYIRGYELVQVPRFRNDIAGWREFVNSFARQLCLDETRGRSQSKLMQAVREAFDNAGEDEATFEDPEHLLTALRKIWQRPDRSRIAEGARTVSQYHLR